MLILTSKTIWRTTWLLITLNIATRLSNKCATIIDFIKKTLTNKIFINRHKINKTDFTRKRSLPFATVFIFLINLLKSSLQNELDKFFKTINNTDVPHREVTASAFCQARKKLNYTAFIELLHKCVALFYKLFPIKRWHGFRLLAIDGSTVQLPNEQEIKQHFGCWHPAKSTEPCPMARVSQMFDVLNHITVDTIIAPKKEGERSLAAKHFEYINEHDLILSDRGYPAFWLFQLIVAKGANYCARLPINRWKVILKDFLASSLKETIIDLKPGYLAVKDCEKYGLPITPLKVRLIRIELDNGATEVLATSLIDYDLYPYELFKDLYFKRWPVEEDYKLLKSRIELANFTGKSVLAVYQDFYARVFMANLTSMLAFPVHDKIVVKHENSNLEYKINWTQALAKMRESGILLFFRNNIVDIIKKLWQLFFADNSAIRPGRKFPRKYSPHTKKFYFAYKPIS
jgi:hypothetical protein